MYTVDTEGSWSFANHFARNVLIFGVDNSSSSRSDNRTNQVKVQLMVLLKALGHRRKSLVLS